MPKIEVLLPDTQVVPECSNPPTPPAGRVMLYLDQGDGKLKVKKSGGTVVDLEGGGAGGAAWGSITGTLSSQSDLQTVLDAKAASSHSHTIANVTSLQSTLDGKAATSHGHVISDVTSLQSSLDGKCASNDPRLSDARTPLAHSITSAHNGFPGGTSNFLRADGTWAAPAGGPGGSDPPEGSYAPGSFTIATGKFRVMAGELQLTGSQELTVQGTGRLSLGN